MELRIIIALYLPVMIISAPKKKFFLKIQYVEHYTKSWTVFWKGVVLLVVFPAGKISALPKPGVIALEGR